MTDESMTPEKLKRHFTSKHTYLARKHVDYFKRLLSNFKEKGSTSVKKKVKVSEKALVATFIDSEQTVMEMKTHNIREKFIKLFRKCFETRCNQK